MDPREELEALRRLAELEAKAGGSAPQPQGYQHQASSNSAEPGAPEQLGRGLMYGLQKASAGLTGMLPRPLENALVKAGVSPSQEQLTAGKKFVDETGPLSTAGQMTGDIVSQALPTKKLAMATQGLSTIPRAVAGLAGTAGINSAMTPDKRGEAAVIGAGSSALGNTMARLMGGPMRTSMTPEAKTLMAADVPLTPGQMLTGTGSSGLGRSIRGLEDKAQSIPFVGDVIKERVRAGATGFNTAKVNEALAPLKQKVASAGDDAVDEALEKISNSYDAVLPDIKVPANRILRSFQDASNIVDNEIPLLGGTQYDKLQKYINTRVLPFHNSGADMSGTVAKKIDAELGEFARQYKTGGPENRELSEAFKILRDEWRRNMVGTTPEARDVLKATDTARAKLEPMVQATRKGNGETMSPQQLRKQLLAKDQAVDPVTQAGARVLPGTVPDSGTAGRAMLGSMLLGGGGGAAGAAGGAAVGASTLLPAALAAGGLAGMYTNAGSKYMAQGVEPLIKMLRKNKSVDMDALEAYVRQMTTQPVRAGLNTN